MSSMLMDYCDKTLIFHFVEFSGIVVLFFLILKLCYIYFVVLVRG